MMKFCLKCKGTGRILERRLSEYVNSYDYYPVSCPDCHKQEQEQSNTNYQSQNSFTSYVRR